MKHFTLNHLPAILILVLFTHCKKTNTGPVTTPFVNNDSVQFFFPPKDLYNGPAPISFTSIVIDPQNNKWLLCSAAIFRFDGKNWFVYNSINMPVDPTLYQSSGLLCDSKGIIYSYLQPYSGVAATENVLIVYKNNIWKSFTLPFKAKSMTLDKWTDQVYFLTEGDSVYEYDGSDNFSDPASYTSFYLGGDYYVINFTVSADSFLVFFNQNLYGAKTDSAHTGFLVRTANGDTKQYNYPDSSNILLLSGIFGSDGKSVYMTGGPSFGVFGSSENYDSIYVYNGSNWNAIPLHLPGDYIWPNFMKYSNNGVLWLSYGWSGMASYENQQFRFHDLGDSKPYSHIADFAFDADNVKWLACSEGLIRYVVE